MLVVFSEEAVDFGTKFGVRAAGFAELGFACGTLALEGLGEHLLDLTPQRHGSPTVGAPDPTPPLRPRGIMLCLRS